MTTRPRRVWRDRVSEATETLTPLLRAPGSTAELRPIQSVLLLEAAELGGGFGSATVGAGKTLIGLLAGELLLGERTLVLTTGGMKRETEDLFRQYRADWPAQWQGAHYKLLGFSDLSKMPSKGQSLETVFNGLPPTVLVIDECHKLRNVGKNGSAVANQVAALMAAHPDIRVVALSGTPRKDRLIDYAHILDWCLKDGSPLPRGRSDQQDWSDVIDRGDMARSIKVARQLGLPDTATLEQIQDRYLDILKHTPGVVISEDQFQGPLSINEIVVYPRGMEVHFQRLRDLYQRPDGWELSPDVPDGDEDEERKPDFVTGGTVWACARQMALGFCYLPDPRPPEPYVAARRAYLGMVRRKIAMGEYYTEFQVRQACERGEIDSSTWRAWSEVQPTFEPRFRPQWLSDCGIEAALEWGDQAPGIIWVDHTAFGRKLAEESGWTYYGAKGLDNRGNYISNDRAKQTVIASRPANGTGRNLQAFNRMLFSAIPKSNEQFEQNVGREHREGQKRAVTVDVWLGCREHVESVDWILQDAAVCAKTLMQQKANMVAWGGKRNFPTGHIFGVGT